MCVVFGPRKGMIGMFEDAQFSEQARQALSCAQREATQFQHVYIGTEHLLLGLLDQKESLALHILDARQIAPIRIRRLITDILKRGHPITNIPGLTERGQNVLSFASDEARQEQQNIVNTGYLLIGLVREQEGIAAGVLESLGLSVETIRLTARYIVANQANAG